MWTGNCVWFWRTFFQEEDCSRLNYLCSVVGKIKKNGSQQCLACKMEPYIVAWNVIFGEKIHQNHEDHRWKGKGVYLQASLPKFDTFYAVVMSFRRCWPRQPLHRAKLSGRSTGSFDTRNNFSVTNLVKKTPDGNVLNLKVLESNKNVSWTSQFSDLPLPAQAALMSSEE